MTVSLLVLVFAGCDTEKPKVTGVDKTIKIQCGDSFNLEKYLKEKVKISDKTDDGVKNYTLDKLEHSIECDKKIFNSKTGEVNTGEFGEYRVQLTVSDKSGNDTTVTFKLVLNPIRVEKGFYVYEDNISKDEYALLGYCSFENTSKKPVAINGIEMNYNDKDGVSVCNTGMPDYAPQYLAAGQIGFVQDTNSGSEAKLESEDSIAEVEVNIDYKRTAKKDKTTLQVGQFKKIYDYRYNTSGFAAETIITNPHNIKADDFVLIAGMYDKHNKLIGVMDNGLSSGPIKAKGKTKTIACYLPDSKERPKATKYVKGAAYLTTDDF